MVSRPARLAPLALLALLAAGCARKPDTAAAPRRYIELTDHRGQRLTAQKPGEPDARIYTVGVVVVADGDSWTRLPEEDRARLAEAARRGIDRLTFVKRVELPREDDAPDSAPRLDGSLEPYRQLQARRGWDAVALVTGKQLAARDEDARREGRAVVQTRVDVLLFDAWRERVLWRAHGAAAVPVADFDRADSETLDGAARAGWRQSVAALETRLDPAQPPPEHRRHGDGGDDGDDLDPAEAFWIAYLGINIISWIWEIIRHR